MAKLPSRAVLLQRLDEMRTHVDPAVDLATLNDEQLANLLEDTEREHPEAVAGDLLLTVLRAADPRHPPRQRTPYLAPIRLWLYALLFRKRSVRIEHIALAVLMVIVVFFVVLTV